MLRYFTRRVIRKWLKKGLSAGDVRFVDFRAARRILLLVEENQYEAVQPLVREIESSGILVRLYLLQTYKGKASKAGTYPPTVRLIEEGDLKWSHSMPRQPLLDEVAQERADAMIDLTPRICLPFYILLIHAQIPLKMGLRKSGLSPYNFQIDQTGEKDSAKIGTFLLRYWRSFIVEKEKNS